jgi:transposase
MSTDAPILPDDAATLKELASQQHATIVALRRELEQLKHYTAQLLRARYGPRGERFDPNQQQLFDEPEEAEASETSAPAETRVAEHVRRRGRRKPLPADLPRERVEHDLPEAEKTCPCCGEIRQRIGEETSEQLEFIPASLKVIEHVRLKYACRACQEHVAIAAAPAKPIAKGVAGPGLLSALVVGKWSDHLSLYRLEDVFARHGVEITRGTLCRWAAAVAGLLLPLYELMVERVRRSRVIHTDDTPVKVLDAALPHCRTGRFWVYCGDWRNPYSVYDYTSSRKRDGPAEFLKDFSGYLQADAFAGYDGIYAAGAVRQVLCWAHARRKFFDAQTSKPDEAGVALAYIGRLYKVEREAKQRATEYDLDDPQQRRRWHADRRALRRERSLPVLVEFRAWLEEAQRRVLPKSPMGQAIAYALPRWEGLSRYCEDGQLSADNNLAERTLRPCAIGRKNWTFLGNDHGGRTAAILYSFTASCKANQVEPFAYLRDAIQRMAELRHSAPIPTDRLTPLLPDTWLKHHPEAHRPWSR